ncbi:hypothetical protein KC338_g151 [Hortaea werneckii]|nr:hypothetical protein KC338_g151 [Hortaea werneckii]
MVAPNVWIEHFHGGVREHHARRYSFLLHKIMQLYYVPLPQSSAGNNVCTARWDARQMRALAQAPLLLATTA